MWKQARDKRELLLCGNLLRGIGKGQARVFMTVKINEVKSNEVVDNTINDETMDDAIGTSSDDVSEEATPTNGFAQLGLHPDLVATVTSLGYTTPTPIQESLIPVMLSGRDVIGQAQTGTGKTAAFSLPIVEMLTPNARHIQVLVLAPTRELAMQVAKSMKEYGKDARTRVLAIYGGQPYGIQIGALKRGVDVVVGTPGRMLDLIKQRNLDLSQVSTVVMDEADEMLSMGFIEDIESILSAVPTQRQTALFSATMPPEIRRLADKYMVKPEMIAIKNKQMTVAAIEQRYILANERDKLAALTRLFEMEEISSALIFARTRVSTGRLANELATRGYPAEVLNGDLSQEAREAVLKRFKQNKLKVLVATDIAARGLDIDDISHVFNFDLPDYPETYVHRIGRTGRAGKTGIAISIITPKEQWKLRRIEGYTKQKMTQSALPTADEIVAFRDQQSVDRLNVWLKRGRCGKERETVEALMAEGYDPVEIAASALKMSRAQEKHRPIAHVGELNMKSSARDRGGRGKGGRSAGKSGRKSSRPASKKSHEVGMVRLIFGAGKQHGLRVNDVVGAIAHHANIPGKSIGAILIQDEQTLVDVPEQFVPQVLAKAGVYKVKRRPIVVERA